MREPTWPLTFRDWWQDGDQDDPNLVEPWETFVVRVRGEEALDTRDLLPADVPALLEALFDGYEGLLYCALHQTWLDPPDATHRDYPELDPINSGESCGNAVNPYRALQFLSEAVSNHE